MSFEKFNQLRKEHGVFIYHSYHIDNEGFSFHFSIDEYHFNPKWKWNGNYINENTDMELIKYIVFSIGMTELVSYWKCACCPVVEVRCGALDEWQIAWWKKLYFNGLGEFFYRNDIETDIESFMEIVPTNTDIPRFAAAESEAKGALIAVGGGKDSVVTLELLSDMKEDNLCFIINPRGATLNCAHTAGYSDDKIVGIGRTIDKALLERNAEGWLNGHTPFSAIVAFSSYLMAVLTGKKYIALSNESSANEGNVGGTTVNHQYSKSTEFESDFREFCKRYFITPPEYFSLLRPWSEWQIAKKFVTYEKYLDVFQSCNVGSKTDTWCGKCAKCLYVYIMLSAFLEDEKLVKIFGSDMLDNAEFSDLFNGLVYQDYDKPFECVGTRAEISLALYRSYTKRKDSKLPLLLREYIAKNPDEPENLDDFFDDNNFVPEELLYLLKGE